MKGPESASPPSKESAQETAQESVEHGRTGGPPPVGPLWLTPATVILPAIVLGAAVMLDVVVDRLGFVAQQKAIFPFTLITTVLLTLAVARRALRYESPGATMACCFLGGFAAGTLNAMLNFVMSSAQSRGFAGLWEALISLVPGVWGFALFGGGPGIIYGVCVLPLCDLVRQTNRAPTHRDAWAATYSAGLWLLVVGAMSALLGDRQTAGPGLAAGLGTLLLLITLMSDILLTRWLRRLSLVETDWRIVTRDSSRHEPDLLPLSRWEKPVLCDGVVVRGAAGGAGPYRTSPQEVAVALIPLQALDHARSDLARSLLTVVGGLLVMAVI
jgi:hypothetical protein